MKIRPAHSMTGSEMSIWLSLPRHDGHIVNPAYLNARSPAYDAYLAELRAWCQRVPRNDWPEWLQQFADQARIARAQAGAGTGARSADRCLELDPVRPVAAGAV